MDTSQISFLLSHDRNSQKRYSLFTMLKARALFYILGCPQSLFWFSKVLGSQLPWLAPMLVSIGLEGHVWLETGQEGGPGVFLIGWKDTPTSLS